MPIPHFAKTTKQGAYTTTIACPTCDERVDVTVDANVSGRYRRATRLDPEEYPEVDIVAVYTTKGLDVVDQLSESELEAIRETVLEQAEDDAAGRKADADDRKYEEMRDRRLFGDDR